MKNTEEVIKDLTALRETLEECIFEIDSIVAKIQDAEWMAKKIIFQDEVTEGRINDGKD